MTSRYLMVGAGGTGTHLLHPLINYLDTFHTGSDYLLGVMDGDQVEQKNLSRQLFQATDIYSNKAKAAIHPFESNTSVRAFPEFLGKDNIDKFITDGTVVLICVDNFPVRARIEQHCNNLDNVVVINGGNEEDSGSCQIWVRENGTDITPRLSFLHPEIYKVEEDRAELSCQAIAQLPGGEQLIIANMSSAMWMLTALMDYHRSKVSWTELHFDLSAGKTFGMDNRTLSGWK